jgi:Arm domain-containing DNA-binding protein
MFADGGGLYLKVTGGGACSWIFRYTRHGQAREMGLGPLHALGLAAARVQAAECRRLLVDGRDPIDERNKEREAARLEAARTITFRAAANTRRRRSSCC